MKDRDAKRDSPTSLDLADMAKYHSMMARFHSRFGRRGLAEINQRASVNARSAIPAMRKAEILEAVEDNQLALGLMG